jgi:hypothetical protein
MSARKEQPEAQRMKTKSHPIHRYTYWASTALLALLYLGGAGYYFIDMEGARKAIALVGYPPYLVPLLGIAKLLGVIAVLSRISIALCDLAYAGMFFHLLLAVSAHLNAGGSYVPAAAGLLALIASFSTQNAARAKKSPHAPG